ncbi:MAG: complex I NDUFA9 subunit family protein [Rickettsiales bacterium]
MKNKIVTIIGGSGFIGSQIAKDLLKLGFLVQIISRDPYKNQDLKTAADVGHLYFCKGDINNIEEIKKLVSSSYAVINLVGVLFEKGRQNFYYTHTSFPGKLASICKELEIPNLIHFSALGVDKAICSNYAKSKYSGEKNILEQNSNAIIFRPSVVFGRNDDFTNKFKSILKYSPVFPMIKDGSTKFQPVYVGDVGKAICKVMQNPKQYYGKTIELGGAKKYTLKNILEIIKNLTKSNCMLLEMPEKLNYYTAYLTEFMSKPVLTRDQVALMRYHNVVSDHSKELKFRDLQISPVDFEKTVSQYIK